MRAVAATLLQATSRFEPLIRGNLSPRNTPGRAQQHLMPDSFVPRRALGIAIALFIAIAWFANIGHRVLQHPDEGRYAEIPREMMSTGDWLTPRLNGLKYFEKPPLQYWLTAATYEAFGVSAWTARLWTALAGLIGVLVIAWAGLRLGGPALAWSAGLALSGMLWQVAISQILTLDALLCAFLAIGFAAFVVAQRAESSPSRRRWTMWLTWAALAGATMTKGPIGAVLPAGALVLYTLVTRDLALWRRLHLVTGLVIYFALTAPWFVLVSRHNPEFASFFFVHEHVDRFLTTTHRRTGSVFYFVPILATGALPWIMVILVGAHRAWREGTANAIGFSWQRFALTWAAFVFLFFSASSSKLASYILPMFAPLALVVGWLLLRLEARVLVAATVPITVIAFALLGASLVAYGFFASPFAEDKHPNDALLAFAQFIRAALLCAAIGGALAWAFFRRSTPRTRFGGVAVLALSTLVSTQIVIAGLDSFRHTRSAYDILRKAGAALGDPAVLGNPSVPFYQVRMYDQTIPFYLRRTTRVVEFKDELALGIDAEPVRAVDNVELWMGEWLDARQAFAVMVPQEYELLSLAGLPMKVLARDSKRVIVSRE